MKKPIPIFNLYKILHEDVAVNLQNLESTYRDYNATEAHRHNYYELIFFNNSGGVHEIDFKNYPIQGNTIHFVAPEQVHMLKREKHVKGFVLAFSSDLFLSFTENFNLIENLLFFESLQTHPIVQLSSKTIKQFHNIIAALQVEFKNSLENKNAMMCFLICELLILLKRNQNKLSNQSQGSPLIIEFKRLVKKHFLKTTLVSDYAQMLNISAGHLNESVKKASEKNAKAIIQEQVILEAKRLLYHSNYNIKEIAFYLNFEDASHFNRFFKKENGLTPLQFRTNSREKYH